MLATRCEQDPSDPFGVPNIPTLLAQRQFPRPIAFTRLRGEGTGHEKVETTPREAAFVILVAMAPMEAGTISVFGAEGTLPAAKRGDTFVADLRTILPAKLNGPHDLVRCHLPAGTLNRLADDRGLPRVRGLRTTETWVSDPVMNGLALSLLPALDAPSTVEPQFLDAMALALHVHVLHRYGWRTADEGSAGPGLAAWQLRRVWALTEAEGEPLVSIADLAGECRLSASHFGRRFLSSTGMSPHRWLTSRRIERAKELLLGGAEPLSDIALACGFVDQSHFTRVFTRLVGQSPGRWRRQHRH